MLLTVREAAQLLSIGRSTIYELITAREIEVVHIGRSVRVPVAALHAFIEGRSGAAGGDRGGGALIGPARRG